MANILKMGETYKDWIFFSSQIPPTFPFENVLVKFYMSVPAVFDSLKQMFAVKDF